MNRMIFDAQNKAEVVKFNELMSFLISYNTGSFNAYNEIHIYQEEMLIIIEWEQVPYSKEYGGNFVYIDEEHRVLKEVCFPDNHCEYLDDNEVEEAINEWLKDNPGWTKTTYGTWMKE